MNKLWLRCLLLVLLVSLVSCGSTDPNEQIDEGSVTGNTYTNDEIGWTIEIPSGWNIISRDKIKEMNSLGKESITEATGQSINAQGLKQLLCFQKNSFNSFLSTSYPFDTEAQGEWEKTNVLVKQVLLETYTKSGFQTDASDTETVKIDGLDFRTFQIQLHGPDGKVALTQRLYGRLINGYDFGITISYNSEADRDVMLGVLQNSRFKK